MPNVALATNAATLHNKYFWKLGKTNNSSLNFDRYSSMHLTICSTSLQKKSSQVRQTKN